MQSTESDRRDLELLHRQMTTGAEPDVAEILEKMQLVILRLFRHVDELQGEIGKLRQTKETK